MIAKKWIVVLVVCSLLLSGFAIIGLLMSNVEKPNYEVIASKKNLEIRRYAPIIVAEVEVAGKRKDAIREGFRLLADYIFGNNTVQKKIAMMVPVQQEKSQKIAMTAPVQQQWNGKVWKISFVMPAKYSLESLPKPNNNCVMLKEVPAKKFVVIQFSGTNSDENITTHERQLREYIQSNQIKTTGSSKYAFYNPPWTLPFLRRNEVMIEINE